MKYYSSNGVAYYLFTRMQQLRGNRQRLYFFAKHSKHLSGDACEMPAGYEVIENPYGFPMLKKKANF